MHRRNFLQISTLTMAACLAGAHRATAAGWNEGSTVPSLSPFGLEGGVPALKGKVVYLDFWASWCLPCKASFPVLNKFQAQFGPKGFTVIGISVDDTTEAMQGFLQKIPAHFPVARDAGHKLVAAADVSTMPTAFLIDRKGVVKLVHSGFREKDEATLSARIAALLG